MLPCTTWTRRVPAAHPKAPWRSLKTHPLLTGLALAALCGAATGCVRVYQPMSGLHGPVLVDTRLANFSDVRLTVHCVPEDMLTHQEASALCQKVGALFEVQGAVVETRTQARSPLDEALDGSAEDEARRPTDLTLELRARQTHTSNHPLSWALNIVTFTLLPAITEESFAQDVVVRDGSGFLLATESLEGRTMRYFGLGTWAGHKLADLTWRKEEDELTGEVFGRDLSTDLYRQLSQTVFNAKVQWQILREATPPRTGP